MNDLLDQLGAPILDAHAHFWDPRQLTYPWLGGIPQLDRVRLPADYRAGTAAPIDRAVMVQAGCEQPADEALWADELAAREPLIACFVADVALERGEAVDPELAMLAALGNVRAVRRMLAFDAERALGLTGSFLAGLAALPAHDLGFELRVACDQLEIAAEIVARSPSVRFVLDHAGNPDIARHALEPWRTDLRRLARLPNAWCKISGLVTEADRARWTVDDIRPYIAHAIACFGWDRVMFGSDWPIVTQACEVDRWLAALRVSLGPLTHTQASKLFRTNAIAFYRLHPDAAAG